MGFDRSLDRECICGYDRLKKQVLDSISVAWGGSVIPVSADRAAITQVTIPDGVTEVYQGAFSGFSALTTVTATDSVKLITDGSFSGLTTLTSVSFPGVEKLSGGAFAGCSNFQASTATAFPKLKVLIDGSLSGCSSLSYIQGVYSRSGITDFSLPELEYIDGSATGSGVGYRTINCPKLREVGYGCFKGQLYGVILENEDGTRNDLYLPECVKIGESNFHWLRCGRIILPKIEEIGKDSFNSSEFTACIMSNPTKVCKLTAGVGSNFVDTMNYKDDDHYWFYVPKALIDQYKTEWGETLAERFRAIEDYPDICE